VSIRIERMTNEGGEETFYVGDKDTDGSWRLIIDSDNLSIQKRESGVWVEKSAFTP